MGHTISLRLSARVSSSLASCAFDSLLRNTTSARRDEETDPALHPIELTGRICFSSGSAIRPIYPYPGALCAHDLARTASICCARRTHLLQPIAYPFQSKYGVLFFERVWIGNI